MRKFLISLLLISQTALADCNIKSASVSTSEHQVGPIQNLVKDIGRERCTVTFDLVVDGQLYHLNNTYEGTEQPEALCYYARDIARKNLLLDLPGKFVTEQHATCKEGTAVATKLKVGDSIMENEVRRHKMDKEFKYQGRICRLFVDQYDFMNDTRTYNGVICRVQNSGIMWQIVDKW